MRRIITEFDTYKEIPYMLLHEEGARALPLVVFVHGFMNDKYEGANYAMKLAREGFAVACFDLDKHGERSESFMEEVSCDADFGFVLFGTIKRASEDINTLIEYLREKDVVDGERIGTTGFSIGANACFHNLVANATIKTSVPILGAPDFRSLMMYGMEKSSELEFKTTRERELYEFVNGLNPYEHLLHSERRPLLMINASKDEDVPAQYSQSLYQAIKDRYDECGSELELFVANEFHYVSDEMINHAIEWLKNYL